MTSFADLDLVEPLRKALQEKGYTHPTPIQAKAIPELLAGRDVLGVAQTGTGKTAAFALPVLQFLSQEKFTGKRPIRCLVLTPTRELASQIGESFEEYGRFMDLRHHVIFGGVGQNPQVQALKRGIDILVATPGRLLDLQDQGFISLRSVEFLILDEADRMLDMGFIHDIRKVLAVLPDDRQNLLFSATMPQAIVKLAADFLHDPVRVEVTPQSTPVERIEQQVMYVDKGEKKQLLLHLMKTLRIERTMVFTRTKHGANRLVEYLEKEGVTAAALHGNKSQNARTKALDGFKNGDVRALVATDVAARGIDIDGVTHVFNFDLPNESESYVHRIGRTGRAGAEGMAIAFCDDSEGGYLRDIERLTKVPIAPVLDQPFHCHAAIPDARASGGVPGNDHNGSRGGRRGGGGGRSGGPRRGGGGGGGGGARRGGGGGRRGGRR